VTADAESISERDRRRALTRGGLAGPPFEDPLPRFDPFADGEATDVLVDALATMTREMATLDALLIWEDPDDTVLGYLLGRALGVPVVRAFDQDGLVGHGAGLVSGARVVLFSDAVRDPATVRAARALAEREGAKLVGTAVLVATDALDRAGADGGVTVALEPLVREAAPSEDRA